MTEAGTGTSRGLWSRWTGIPLYLRILGGLFIGVAIGLILGPRAEFLEVPAKIILQLLGVLAPPLIFIAVVHVLMTTVIKRNKAARLAFLLILNTSVAIFIGLAVANVLQPGKLSKIGSPTETLKELAKKTPMELVMGNIPKSLTGPFGDSPNIIGVIILALAGGLSIRELRSRRSIPHLEELIESIYQILLIVLHWVIQLVPFGVLGIVASIVGTKGFAPFYALGYFIVAVVFALFLQTCWYMIRIRLHSWASPKEVLQAMRDALVMAFSTSSSTVTMPLTYECLHKRLGVREESASMGALVGANFNNDGTALYEAMSALFVAQLLGIQLSGWEQVLVVLTSILASVGAAGIPEAGLVTMTLVFTAVGLPVEYIALLIPVDWFLDRCRTTINVLGDVNTSCMLDGPVKEIPEPELEPSESIQNFSIVTDEV
ncbi:dicarboxylate/amino acid:cation symporter [Planctomicrobium sp. SH527]|uniref:dicarboxylate/amino acid:cation symporter n=1 Tax=Planctomicrobium sp. SH527 TaxID=3448123 RepID=UPI003F5B9B8C